MLTVKSFGKFEISDGVNVINDEALRSDMLKKLFLYMLTHREYPATIQAVSEALWQEDEIDNPVGALKNLMYRLRNLLKNAFGEEKYIITSQGAYAWNSEIEVDFDVECFEAFYKQAKAADEKNIIIENYEKAIAYYKGEFMEKTLDTHWAATLSTYYHSMFLNATKSLAELYMEEGRYQDVEAVSVNSLKMDCVDEELYCYHIMALIKENKCDLAIKRYEEAVKTLYSALGVRHLSKLQNVQKEILKMNKGNETEALEKIHIDMVEDEQTSGAFFCGYPVFREIYRLEVRKNARLGEAEAIVLFTVEVDSAVKTDNEKMTQFLINQGVKNLEETLKRVLRIGDVAAKYSDSQFIVLLQNCTCEGSIAVAQRVVETFETYNKGKKIIIKTEAEQISEVNSEFVK